MKKTRSIMLTICLLFGILSALPLHASALSPPYVSAVSIAGSAERTVLIGDEIELTASIGAEGLSSAFVLWETDNADVLSVNGGDLSVSGDPPQSIAKVTALAAGTATVTIYASMDMNPCEFDESAEITIHVIDPATYSNNSVVIENTWRVNITDASVPETVTVNGTDYLDTEEADAAKYLGYAVNLTLDGDTIIGVTPDEIQNDVIKADCRDVTGVENGTLYYYKHPEYDKYPTPIPLAEDAVLLINNRTATLEEFAEIESGNVTAISNDGNTENGYEYLLANSYTNQMVISHAPIGVIEGFEECPTTTQTYYDLTEEGVKNIFYLDGVRSSYPEVKYTEDKKSFLPSGIGVMSVVSVIGDDTPLRIFYVSNRMESGTVTRIVYTDNSNYSIDSSFNLKAEDGVIINIGDEKEFFVNVDGKIVFAVPMYQTANYHMGYLLDQDVSTSFGKTRIQLLFLDENGQEVINELSYELYLGTGGHSPLKRTIENLAKFPLEQGVFWYRTSNSTGLLLDVIIPNERTTSRKYHLIGTDLTGTYDAKNHRILSAADTFAFAPDAPAFIITDETDPKNAGGVSIIKDVFQDGETITGFSVYGYDDTPECIVLNDGTAPVSPTETPAPTEAPTGQPTFPPMPVVDESDNVVIVTSVSTTKFGDDDGYVIEGLKNGKPVTLNVCNARQLCWNASLLTQNRIEQGDVIMVAEYNNFVSDIEQKVDANALKFRQLSGSNYQQNVRYSWEDFINLATERKNNDITFANDTEKNLNGACFTLVSNNGSGRLTIKNSSIGYINTANTNGYRYVVYVHSYDNTPIDVVIYEFYPNTEIPMADIPNFADPSDANGDGKTDAKDVTFLRRSITNGQGSKDVNLDGKIDAKDVTFLRRFITNDDHYDPAI